MDIKQKLLEEIKIREEKKRKTLLENKIIKQRFRHSVNNKKVSDAFMGLISEIKYLNKQGFNPKLMNENLITLFSQMFDQEGVKFIEVVKNKLVNHLCDRLQVTDFERDVIERAVAETDNDDVSRLFTDVRFLASKIANEYSTRFDDRYISDLSDFTKDVVSLSQNDELKKKLEDMFVDKLKPLMGDINSNMELKLKDIRDNMLS